MGKATVSAGNADPKVKSEGPELRSSPDYRRQEERPSGRVERLLKAEFAIFTEEAMCRRNVTPQSALPAWTLEDAAMTLLKWALVFLVVSIIAGILGFTGVSIVSADIARALFYLFLVIFLVLLVLGLTVFRA
jgi:uncharacterized membrane protein YtjA (UPF0391 family)